MRTAKGQLGSQCLMGYIVDPFFTLLHGKIIRDQSMIKSYFVLIEM